MNRNPIGIDSTRPQWSFHEQFSLTNKTLLRIHGRTRQCLLYSTDIKIIWCKLNFNWTMAFLSMRKWGSTTLSCHHLFWQTLEPVICVTTRKLLEVRSIPIVHYTLSKSAIENHLKSHNNFITFSFHEYKWFWFIVLFQLKLKAKWGMRSLFVSNRNDNEDSQQGDETTRFAAEGVRESQCNFNSETKNNYIKLLPEFIFYVMKRIGFLHATTPTAIIPFHSQINSNANWTKNNEKKT